MTSSCVPTEQLQASLQECMRLRATAEDTRAGSAKLERDMEGLSDAFNALEAHCAALEARLREAEAHSGNATGSASGIYVLLAWRPVNAWACYCRSHVGMMCQCRAPKHLQAA